MFIFINVAGQDGNKMVYSSELLKTGGDVKNTNPNHYRFSFKKEALPLSFYFVSGLTDGLMDYLQFKYEGKNQFWQPDISCNNKWKNGDKKQGEKFFGSSTVFVGLTDGWHLSKTVRNLFTGATIVLKFGSKKKWYYYLIDGVIYQAVNRIGFNITYNTIKF